MLNWNYNNRWSRTSFMYSSKFACKFLSFSHFLKTFSHHSVLFFVFSFSLLSFNSSIIIFLVSYLETRHHCYRKTTSWLNKLLLGNLRTNNYCERVIIIILPSSQSKIEKKILSSLINQHSVILPSMLYWL